MTTVAHVDYKSAHVAAEWWADQLREPSAQFNGDDFQTMLLTSAALRGYTPLTEEQLTLFTEALTLRINQALTKMVYADSVTIRVDYGPDVILSDACEVAGIDVGMRFPAKTVQWVYKDSVVVSYGYGGRDKKIWPIEEQSQ